MSSTILGNLGARAAETSRTTGAPVAHGVQAAPAHSRISWGAVFAGATVALASTLLLSLLGAALGAGSINPLTAHAADLERVGQGAGLWQVVNYMLSMALGGYVAARLSGTHSHLDGELHGLTTWAIAALFGTWLFAQLLGGAVGLAGQGVGAVASRLADTAGSIGASMVPDVRGTAMVERLRRGLSTGGDPASMTREQIEGEIALLVGNGLIGGLSDTDRTRLVALVAAEGGVTRDEASRRVARMEAEARTRIAQAEATARSAADTVAHGTAVASRALFAALSLGLLGALIGAWVGTRHKRTLHPVVTHAAPVLHHDAGYTVHDTGHPVAQRTVYTATETVRPGSVSVLAEDGRVIERR